MAWKEPKTVELRQKAIAQMRLSFLLRTKRIQREFADIVERYLTNTIAIDQDGKVIPGAINYRQLNQLGVVADALNSGPMREFLNWMTKSFERMNELNSRYFSTIAKENFNQGIQTATQESLAAKYGIRQGGIVSGGMLSTIGATASQRAYDGVRRAALSGISQGLSFGAFKQQLRGVITGQGGALGIIENVMYTAAYDSFQQYDRELQRTYANELGLEYAIYSGDVRKTTRDWCERWAGEVLTREEIEEWKYKDWTGKNSGAYDPFTDCGGYNCTHIWNWISEELAFQLRPELKDQK